MSGKEETKYATEHSYDTKQENGEYEKNGHTSESNEENSIEAMLAIHEAKRIKLHTIITIFAIVAIGLIIFFMPELGGSAIEAIGAAIIWILLVSCICSYKNVISYQEKIMPLMISQVYHPNLQGKLNYNIPKPTVFENEIGNTYSSYLFSSFNRECYEDTFTGSMNNTEFGFRELRLESGNKHRTTEFYGIHIQIKYNDIIGTRTLFNKDTSVWGHHVKSIGTENPEFNRMYSVYSDDFEETARLLSSRFVSKLKKLHDSAMILSKKGLGKTIKISVDLNILDIFIPCELDFFEPSFFSKTTIKDVRRDQLRLIRILDIVDILTSDVEFQHSDI